MIKPRAKLLPANPRAIVQTSTGWRYPDGTVKPFYKQRSPTVIERRSLWARILGKVGR